MDPRSLDFYPNTRRRIGMQGNGHILPRLRCTLLGHERCTQHGDELPSRGYLCKGSGGFLQPPAHHLHFIVPSPPRGSNPGLSVCKVDALQLHYRDLLWTWALRVQTLQPQGLPSAGTRHADLLWANVHKHNAWPSDMCGGITQPHQAGQRLIYREWIRQREG